jgi:ElaB/YqjD/DUF883 family membrane-anchored ribosome-binding protein
MPPIEREIQQLKARLKELEQNLSESPEADTSHNLMERGHEIADHVTSALKDHWDNAADTRKDIGDKVDKFVKENPWQVAGIAAAIGFVLAASASSKRRD